MVVAVLQLKVSLRVTRRTRAVASLVLFLAPDVTFGGLITVRKVQIRGRKLTSALNERSQDFGGL